MREAMREAIRNAASWTEAMTETIRKEELWMEEGVQDGCDQRRDDQDEGNQGGGDSFIKQAPPVCHNPLLKGFRRGTVQSRGHGRWTVEANQEKGGKRRDRPREAGGGEGRPGEAERGGRRQEGGELQSYKTNGIQKSVIV